MAKNTVAPGKGFVPGSTNARAVRHPEQAKRGAAREPAGRVDQTANATEPAAGATDESATSTDAANEGQVAAPAAPKPKTPRKRTLGKHRK